MTKKNNKLHYYFDKEADVFYLSQGKPSPHDRTLEAKNDVLLRVDARGNVRGFTVLNFAHRLGKNFSSIELPIEAKLSLLKTL